MVWNMAAESVACAVVLIVMIFAKKINLIPSLKNRIFQLCLVTSFTSILTNLFSTLMLYKIDLFPLWLNWLVTTIYFIATPFLGAIYFFYCVVCLFTKEQTVKKVLLLGSIPYLLYLLIVVSNLWTGWLFRISLSGGYERGITVVSTYIVFYFYCLLCLVLILARRHQYVGDISLRLLMSFPLISFPAIIVQQFFPSCTLSGAVAACSLLILFLNLQNRRISVDYLTGLPNRQDFLTVLNHRIGEKKSRITVVVISINNFKFINDRFGTQNGDQLLKKFASQLSLVARSNPLYRYGGDQFAVLLENRDEKPLLDALMHLLNKPVSIGNYRYLISAAAGVIQYPDVAPSIDSLLGGLEYAVSLAKKDKCNQFLYCTKGMLDEIGRKKAIYQILQDALHHNSFEVYFQPIWSVELHRFTMAEALLRLNNTPLGPISPAEFIPIAEETGLIVDITYQVLTKVCYFMKELLACSIEIEAIAINMSFIQFMQDNLAQKILDIISNCDVPCSKIKIEITEGVLISNFEMVEQFISSMSEHNVRFGLDDFGTGYSNIASLLQIPFDTIKLDKSLIWSSMHSTKTAFFIKDITNAFKKMNLMVLAEGVETEEQYRFAVDCFCDGIQGFLFARPMPAQDAKEIFAAQLNYRLEPPCIKS